MRDNASTGTHKVLTGLREEWQRVKDDTVITRNSSGDAISLFIDDIWDISVFGDTEGLKTLQFRNLVPAETPHRLAVTNKVQAKQLMYLAMHEIHDDVPAPSTLSARMGCLRDVSAFAARHSHTLFEMLENFELVLAWLDSGDKDAKTLKAMLVELHKLGVGKTGVSVPLKRLHEPLAARVKDMRDKTFQHPPLPTKIFQYFLSACESELSLIENASDDLISELQNFLAGKPFGVPSESLRRVSLHLGHDRLDVYSLGNIFGYLVVLCRMVIMALTGMRYKEARSLPFDCLKVARQDGIDHYLIQGITTKLTGGRIKRTSWVTSHLAVKAVKLAQKVFGAVHTYFGHPGHSNSADGTYRLFCKSGLRQSKYSLNTFAILNARHEALFKKKTLLTITAEDLDELKRIAPFQPWDDIPKFAVGEIWPFTTHQLRRSLALYAQRSGLVSLPTLKRQLQHITNEMALYYARGSAFANNLLADDKNHFAQEWQDSKGLSEYLAYAEQVLFADERLFGGHATWAKSNAVKQSPVSVYSREDAIKMFNAGQIAYKETILGGCTSIEPCEKSPLDWLNLKCLEGNCKDLVVVPSKFQRVIKAQQNRVERLARVDNESVEYRMEQDILESLRSMEQKIYMMEESSNV